MKVVVLTSGGLDSTLVAKLALESGAEVFPLFVNYHQRALARELAACRRSLKALGLSEPKIADISGFGSLIRSGLTDSTMRVYEDAYTPGRNTLFLLVGAAYARTIGAVSVAIGLLHESSAIFPDQTEQFLTQAESLLRLAVDSPITILAPLSSFQKKEVVELASSKGIAGTYSCHLGLDKPCGKCIACREFDF